MSLADLFLGGKFKQTIKRYCAHQGWQIADLRSEAAKLRFRMDSGRSQIVYIIKYGTTLEFSCPSAVAFDSVDEIPHLGSTLLLMKSRTKKIGFWCIEEINNRQTYSYMHNAELSLIDSEYFAKVVRALIRECDAFEESLC